VGYRTDMSFFERITSLVSRDRTARRRGEEDAPADPANAGARDTGGGSDVDSMDRNSTTGTTDSGEFVGRAGGDETGDVGLSGGEARTGERADGRTGAARDD
jgi:hypothetical protein